MADLSGVKDKVIGVVLFADQNCDQCTALHDGIFWPYHQITIVLRLGALSEHPPVDVNGMATTPKAWVAETVRIKLQ